MRMNLKKKHTNVKSNFELKLWRNLDGKTPLHEAAQHGQHILVDQLLQAGAKVRNVWCRSLLGCTIIRCISSWNWSSKSLSLINVSKLIILTIQTAIQYIYLGISFLENVVMLIVVSCNIYNRLTSWSEQTGAQLCWRSPILVGWPSWSRFLMLGQILILWTKVIIKHNKLFSFAKKKNHPCFLNIFYKKNCNFNFAKLTVRYRF